MTIAESPLDIVIGLGMDEAHAPPASQARVRRLDFLESRVSRGDNKLPVFVIPTVFVKSRAARTRLTDEQKAAAAAQRKKFTRDDIVASILDHNAAEGEDPVAQRSALIKYGPLTGKATWSQVDTALRNLGVEGIDVKTTLAELKKELRRLAGDEPVLQNPGNTGLVQELKPPTPAPI